MKKIIKYVLVAGAFLLLGGISADAVSARATAEPAGASMAPVKNQASAHDRHRRRKSHARRRHHRAHHRS
jgi:hypothetical protein